ncbi:MAG: hypothetical protein ACI82A_003757 [Candidatus Azotimanducaceae bacterium]|jgi:hypothetical protein
MAYEIIEDVDQSVIWVAFSGSVDNEEILRLMEELYHLDSYAEFDQFIDFSAVTDYTVTPAGTMNYAETARQSPERKAAREDRKLVMYAPDDLTFGMSRLGSSRANNIGVNLEVFRSLNQALDFIGLTSSPIQNEKSA